MKLLVHMKDLQTTHCSDVDGNGLYAYDPTDTCMKLWPEPTCMRESVQQVAQIANHIAYMLQCFVCLIFDCVVI